MSGGGGGGGAAGPLAPPWLRAWFHFVRLLKFLPAAYFIHDFLSRVDMMTRIRLIHDIDRNKRHYQIMILVNNQGIANPPVSRWLGK